MSISRCRRKQVEDKQMHTPKHLICIVVTSSYVKASLADNKYIKIAGFPIPKTGWNAASGAEMVRVKPV